MGLDEDCLKLNIRAPPPGLPPCSRTCVAMTQQELQADDDSDDDSDEAEWKVRLALFCLVV